MFGVLGPVIAEHPDGRPIALKGPMHRAVLGRLLVARGRVVPVTDLVDDLWVAPPAGAVPAVRTFVAALLGLGGPAEAVPDLDEHVTAHPWREPGWRLLALALYRAGRQGDALAVLRRARDLLTGQLGVEPGPGLRTLEVDILRQEAHLD